LLGLSIFGPGIANGLIAGGPQLGAGAEAGTGLAGAGLGAAGAVGAGAAGGVAAAGIRGGASVAGGAVGAYGAGAAGKGVVAGVAAGTANVAREGALAAVSPLRCAAASLKERFDTGVRAGAGGAAPGAPSGTTAGEPAWATRMRRRQIAAHGASAASHVLRSGDHPSGGTSIDLSEE
jgi:type IV secretion system protein TrbL